MRPHRRLLALIPLALLGTLAACPSPSPTPPEPEQVPTTITLVPGADATIRAGEALSLTAEVRDQDGLVMTHAVAWTLSNGAAAGLSSASTPSGTPVTVTGANPGVTRVSARAGNATAGLDLTVIGPPAFLTAAPGTNGQSAFAGANVAVAPAVHVADALHRPVPGTVVTFTVTAGGGSLVGATAISDANGRAGVTSWRLGAAPGANAVTATTPGASPAVFLATATTPPLGDLAVNVTGLPAGAAANVVVSGPGGYAADVSGSTTLTGLPPATYTVAAAQVSVGGTIYTPAPASQQVAVQAALLASVTVTYTPAVSSTFNVFVDGALFFQTVQTLDGAVPLMADKPAIVRAWVRANRSNGTALRVRLRLFRGGSVWYEAFGTGPAAVPTAYTLDNRGASWEFAIPNDRMVPGLTALVEADPLGEVAESTRADNSFPATGPLALNIQNVPVFSVRFLQICLSYAPVCGRYAAEDQMLQTTYVVHPVWRRNVVPAIQVTTGRDVTTQAGWSALLQDVEAQRVFDGYGGTSVHYVGIVTTPPSITLLGLAYIGGFSGLFNNDNATEGPVTLAHELGHNFGRQHSPCGGPAGVDPGYPFPDGSVGAYGVNLFTGQVTTPGYKDIMTYCPPFMTASPYTYARVFTARQGPFPSRAAAATPVLVVAGRIAGGTLHLDPAVATTAPPTRHAAGAYSVQGLDASGAVLFTSRFAPTPIGDAGAGERGFALAIPVSESVQARVATIRVTGEGRTAARERAPAAQARTGGPVADAVRVRRVGDRVRVEWNAAEHPAVWVRDPRAGAVVGILRDGRGDVATRADALELILSDGVGSTVRRVAVRP